MEYKIKIGKKGLTLTTLLAVLFHLLLIVSASFAINLDWLEFFKNLHGG